MKTDTPNPAISPEYADVLNLPLDQKLELISQLTESVKNDIKTKKSLIKESLSTLKSHEISESILEEIRNSPIFYRQVGEF
jgi:hypothetical protein